MSSYSQVVGYMVNIKKSQLLPVMHSWNLKLKTMPFILAPKKKKKKPPELPNKSNKVYSKAIEENYNTDRSNKKK